MSHDLMLTVPPSERLASASLPEFPPEDPTLARTPVTSTTWHRALGLTIRFDTNDPRVIRAAHEAYGPLVDPDPDLPPDARIRLFVHHVDEDDAFRPRQPLVRSWAGTFWIAASRSSVISGSTSMTSRMV